MQTITPKDVEAMGRYLHQNNWETALAKDLRMEETVFRQWLEGSFTPEGTIIDNLIDIVSIRYCTNQIGKAKALGTFSPTSPLILKQENTGWSAEMDWAIKQKAIAVLKEYKITAITEI